MATVPGMWKDGDMPHRAMILLCSGVLCLAACSSEDDSQTNGGGGQSGGGGVAGSGGGAGSGSGGSAGSSAGAAGLSGIEPTDCITDASADPAHVFACNDDVSFNVSVPEKCPAAGCGLILDVHGFTMSAAMQEANTALAALGRDRGYVVVQPSAPGMPASWEKKHDATVIAFASEAVATWKLDANRVHVTGFSQGGAFSWRLLCDYSKVFASAAPAAFGLESGAPMADSYAQGEKKCFVDGKKPERELSILYMHGTDDGLVPYAEGEASVELVKSALDMGDAEEIDSTAEYARLRHTNAAGTVLEFIRHDYAAESTIIRGHCYPGSRDPGGLSGQLFSFACLGDNAFNWGEEVIAFFEKHTKK